MFLPNYHKTGITPSVDISDLVQCANWTDNCIATSPNPIVASGQESVSEISVPDSASLCIETTDL